MKIYQIFLAVALTTVLATGCATPDGKQKGPISEHIVQPRDTGARIAQTAGLSMKELEALNPGVEWHRLKVGQRVRVR